MFFPAYGLMFCNFMKVIKHILIDSPGFEFSFCSLGIFKGTNKALWFNKRSWSKRERRRKNSLPSYNPSTVIPQNGA